MKDRSAYATVIKTVVCVFTLAIISLGGVGVYAAVSNDRPAVAILLIGVMLGHVFSGIVTARSTLRENDPEAYELRRYD